MSVYAYVYPGPHVPRTYRVWWGRSGTPEYREIVFDHTGPGACAKGVRLFTEAFAGLFPNGTELANG